KVKEAIAHYQAALRARPDSVIVQNNLGAALQAAGDAEAAIDHYRRAVKLKPDYANARYNLGNALLSAGKIHEAGGYPPPSPPLRARDSRAAHQRRRAPAAPGHMD